MQTARHSHEMISSVLSLLVVVSVLEACAP